MGSANRSLPAGAREVAIEAARTAGSILGERLGLVQDIRHKGEIDLVTEVDLAAEGAIVRLLRQRFPEHRILAEEGATGAEHSDFRWIVDPLDGTTNYSHAFPFFCVSIALESHGEIVLGVVYDPIRQELFEAERGQGARLNGTSIRVSQATSLAESLLATGFPYDRSLFAQGMRYFEALSRRCLAVRRMGSAVLAQCYMASGRLDGYWEMWAAPWDMAAGTLIVSEAGGVVTDLQGCPLEVRPGPVLASSPAIHPQMLEALKG